MSVADCYTVAKQCSEHVVQLPSSPPPLAILTSCPTPQGSATSIQPCALGCASCSNRHASLSNVAPFPKKGPCSCLNSHIMQGNLAATQQDWATAEALFVRAKQPEAALAMYRAARRWEDALRVAEAHLPAKVGCL